MHQNAPRRKPSDSIIEEDSTPEEHVLHGSVENGSASPATAYHRPFLPQRGQFPRLSSSSDLPSIYSYDTPTKLCETKAKEDLPLEREVSQVDAVMSGTNTPPFSGQVWQPANYSALSSPVAEMDRTLRRKLVSRSESSQAAQSITSAPATPPSLPHSQSTTSSVSKSSGAISTFSGLHCGSSSGTDLNHGRRLLSARPAFRSRRIAPHQDNEELLWTQTTTGKKVYRKAYILFLVGISLGIIGAAALIVTGFLSTQNKHKYCLVLEDNFDGPLDTSVWKYEQQTGGFGNNEFEWTTASTNNTYTADGMLHLVPTLTSDALGEEAIYNGYTLNLTTAGVCTTSDYTQCGIVSNSSTGVILPPIQSARLSTKGTKSIRYGRVEVRARMPTGDWIWPAIWMMPRDSVYGEWPSSGEIDIVESKGNQPDSRNDQLANVVRSTLHWGPSTDQDAWWRTTGIAKAWRNFFNQDFYTFGLEWDEEGIYTWQGSRVRKYMAVDFNEPFYQRGAFPSYSNNGTELTDPWAALNATNAAPFDQDFYLIMNVAVGGTNGYFGEADKGSNGARKPWSNNEKNAARDFYAAKDEWLPTWPTDPSRRGMVVDYVKMYQQC